MISHDILLVLPTSFVYGSMHCCKACIFEIFVLDISNVMSGWKKLCYRLRLQCKTIERKAIE